MVSVKEIVDRNDVIMCVVVLDCDVGSNVVLKFFIIFGNVGGFFDINLFIGEIVVKKLFDLEGVVLFFFNYIMGN